MKRKLDRLTKEKRQAVIDDVIVFFEKEYDMKIGVIAANRILDFFLQSIGSELYNKGIEDAKLALERRIDELRYDLDDLLDIT